MATLNAAADAGVTFFDTADVYGDGRSERLVGRLLRERGERLSWRPRWAGAATRRSGTTRPRLPRLNDRSRENLGMEPLDLVQLHCPPTDLYYRPEVFADLDAMVRGTFAAYGVSVERVEEALKAIEYPGVATVQIIYNLFRQRPAERVLRRGRARAASASSCASRSRPACCRASYTRNDVRRRRPPELQPPRRGVRRRRDVRRRAVRDRPGRRRGAAAARARGRDARAVRAALDPHARRRCRRSSRVRAHPSRRQRTPPPPTSRRCRTRRWPRSGRSTRSGSRRTWPSAGDAAGCVSGRGSRRRRRARRR